MDAPSSDEDFEGGAIDTNNFDEDDDEDDDEDHFPMMLGDDEDFSDNEEEALATKKKKKKSESLYADADEYEKILEEELNAVGKSEEGNDSVKAHRKKKKRKIK